MVYNIFCAAALWGLWKLRQLVLPGCEMEGHELLTVEHSNYASGLEAVMPCGEDTGLCHKVHCTGDKTSEDCWMNLVSNETSKLLFQKAHCWG